MHSAIYSGWLRHRRFYPKKHAFTYRVFLMYLDLDEQEQVLGMSALWSTKAWRPARFVRSDYFGDPQLSLSAAVRKHIFDTSGIKHRGPIRMLANFRYFGITINPIVCFYCFDEKENLQMLVNVVTNTPWKERIAYVLNCDPKKQYQRIKFKKGMHVSPFNPMDMHYKWSSTLPSEKLNINLGTESGGVLHVDATMALRRTEISSISLNKVLIEYPWMTVKVVAGIYWQALKLWIKHVPVHDHPNTGEK